MIGRRSRKVRMVERTPTHRLRERSRAGTRSAVPARRSAARPSTAGRAASPRTRDASGPRRRVTKLPTAQPTSAAVPVSAASASRLAKRPAARPRSSAARPTRSAGPVRDAPRIPALAAASSRRARNRPDATDARGGSTSASRVRSMRPKPPFVTSTAAVVGPGYLRERARARPRRFADRRLSARASSDSTP